jgi:hypothetical protein
MKKLLGIIVLGLLLMTNANADGHRWEDSDLKISDYLKKGWSITFVNAFKGWSNDEIVYTLQKDRSIVSCKVRKFRLEQCYKPTE